MDGALIVLKDIVHSRPDITDKQIPSYEKHEDDGNDGEEIQGRQKTVVCYKCLYFSVCSKEL